MRSVISAILCATSILALSGDLACAVDKTAAKSDAPYINPWHDPMGREADRSYIIQAQSVPSARREIARVGALPGRELGIINSVTAQLTDVQVRRLNAGGQARAYPDLSVQSESLLSGLGIASPLSPAAPSTLAPVLATPLAPVTLGALAPAALVPAVSSTVNYSNVTPLTQAYLTGIMQMLTVESQAEPLVDGGALSTAPSFYLTAYPVLAGATQLQQEGLNGSGVTIAVLDTGIWTGGGQNFSARILGSVDLIAGGSQPVTSDPYGHGTHVASIAAGGAATPLGTSFGVAPAANLVIVRAFDGHGAGSYSNVIAGLNWIIQNQKKYNIRVLNLSFGAPPQSNYWNDPLNQAVMAAWQAGIVVVCSAGNSGPVPMTIGVPANVPYVITVGALTDNFTPANSSNFRLASFSSTGPTYEGFVKPELVAPGGHMVGSMSYQSYLASIGIGTMTSNESLFVMSGTSQAAAVTSGVVALMLQANPNLTPDQVKCHLIASAQPALNSAGAPAYSVFQQGAGLVNAPGAVSSTVSGCANQGLNIAADLAGTQHFGGPANENANGTYYLMNMNGSTYGAPMSGAGYTWDQSYTGTQGYAWTQAYAWSQGYAWTQGYAWSQGYAWTQGYAWSQGYAWTQSAPWGSNAVGSIMNPASIDDWVPNE